MCHWFETTIQILQIFKNRSNRIVQSLSIEMNSYLTELTKSNHTEWKEINQIKSNQIKSITRKDYSTWV